MADEPVFRFIAVREPEAKAAQDTTRRVTPSHVGGEGSPLLDQVRQVPGDDRTKQRLASLGAAFRQTPEYARHAGGLPFDIAPLAALEKANADTAVAALDVAGFVQSAYGASPSDVVASQAFKDTTRRLGDSVVADALTGATEVGAFDDRTHAIKLLHLLAEVALQSAVLTSPEPLGQFVASLTVEILPVAQPKRPDEPKPQPEPIPPRDDPQRDKRLDDLDKLERAHRELIDALRRPSAVSAATTKGKVIGGEGGDDPDDGTRKGLLSQASELLGGAVSVEPAVQLTALASSLGPGVAASQVVAKPPKLTNVAFNALSGDTKSVLRRGTVGGRTVSPFSAIASLEAQIVVASQTVPAEPLSYIVKVGGTLMDAARFRDTVLGTNTVPPTKLPAQHCDHRVGIGDLLIVRQKLKAYELGDFAHVENVMRGEFREREHRRLNIREEITEMETERETEKERDLQSTERNEMQNETNKTVQEQFQLQAGLQVSGSYGPAVSFSASLNAGFSTSTTETKRKAVNYSREVTEKTSERVRERVREERRLRLVEQVEEINIHRLSNTDNPTGHIRGIYRWLNKIYDAQVFNYGQRMMYEFVFPEPAAYYLWAFVENPPADDLIPKPDPPTYNGDPLKPENLTRGNYQRYLAKYGVTTAKSPPSGVVNLAFFEKQEGKEESNYERATKLAIPDGYEAIGALSNWWNVFQVGHEHNFAILLGSYGIDGWLDLPDPVRGEISVAVHGFQLKAFVATVDVYCVLTAEGLSKWQHETFAAIVEAYENLQARYEEKIAAAKIAAGPLILGRNPLDNRRVEREELEKLVIMTLMGVSYINLDSYFGGGEPFMDIDAACANGTTIQFFENAFEWHNMTYVFYPYFWGRHARWVNAVHIADPDPDFAGFLRAGAARVQVPVRPGFEKAVAHYLQLGEIWQGNDPPLIGDELYVPIVEEISEHLGKLDEGVPYPPGSTPWEVTVPTSLVVVQDLEEIPAIRDSLTGNPVNLMGGNA